MALNPEGSGIEIDRIYDNSQPESRPALVLEARFGGIVHLADSLPDWLRLALGWTVQEAERHWRTLQGKPGIR